MGSPEKLPSSPSPPLASLLNYYASASDRRAFLRDHFDKTAPVYDWISQVLSFGTGQWYRREALARAGLESGMKVLDIACGPGTVTRCARTIVGKGGFVVGLDPSYSMLREARRQVEAGWVQGIAEYLPFSDDTFDLISMGYALRHVADLHAAFVEYSRVLKPGGKLLVMEISRPRHPLQFRLTRFYMRTIVPWITKVGTRNSHAYHLMQYFWDTIEACVAPQKIVEAMQRAGFSRVRVTAFCGGFIRDYSAERQGIEAD